ncbi:hypothetical protein D3C77_306840 [compost metagenome]
MRPEACVKSIAAGLHFLRSECLERDEFARIGIVSESIRATFHKAHELSSLGMIWSQLQLHLWLHSLSVSMRFRYEIDKCHCSGNRKPSMPRLQSAVLAIFPMPGTVLNRPGFYRYLYALE